MRDHIIGEDFELWDIVIDGPLATLKINAEGVEVPKTRADCTAENLKKWEKNDKAKKWLICGLGPDEYKESVHVVFDETNILSERQEHDDEAIGLVRNSNETTAQTEAAPEVGTGDGTGPSTQSISK
ncbi:uncharacterized protein [Nicotiana tomentosiformis]|uniref:uncharacterized protein n=1 Tax=Nicotiana tomentosiformis TaxID=4098 RepID=UPI00388C8A4C